MTGKTKHGREEDMMRRQHKNAASAAAARAEPEVKDLMYTTFGSEYVTRNWVNFQKTSHLRADFGHLGGIS